MIRDAVPEPALTVIFPEGAKKANRDVVLSFLRALASVKDSEYRERKLGKRTIHEVTAPDLQWSWWAEGDDVAFVTSEAALRQTIRVADRRAPSMLSTSWYKPIAAFKDYETDIRGYLDLERLVQLASVADLSGAVLDRVKEELVRRIAFRQLGLTGLKGLTFHFGFDGKYQRNTTILHVAAPEKRKGLLRLVAGPLQCTRDDLPPLVPGAVTVTAVHVDWGKVNEIAEQLFALARLAALTGNGPEELPNLDQILDAEVRRELIAALDPTVVTYTPDAEGVSLLGQCVLVKVKDEKKATAVLEKITGQLRRAGATFSKKTYRGVDMQVLTEQDIAGMAIPRLGRNIRSPIPLTYTIHKGWLVVGLFPQSVKGYILRCEGKHGTWKAPALLEAAIAGAKKAGNARTKLVAVSVRDPRPVVEFGLSNLPVLAAFAGQQLPIDVSKLPNAQTLAEHLFPAVTVCCDDGDALRWESHYSVYVPDEWLVVLLSKGLLLW
jgi:hypothetical protein